MYMRVEKKKKIKNKIQVSTHLSLGNPYIPSLFHSLSLNLCCKNSHRLPEELRRQKERLQGMHQQLSEPAKSQDEVDQMHRHIGRLKQDIGQMESTIEASASKNKDDQLSMFRKQAALIAKKLEQKQAQQDSSTDSKNRLQSRLEDLQGQVAAAGGVTMPKGEDFKTYAKSLRDKTVAYRNKKKKLNIIQSESVSYFFSSFPFSFFLFFSSFYISLLLFSSLTFCFFLFLFVFFSKCFCSFFFHCLLSTVKCR